MSCKFILNLFIYTQRAENFHVETELISQCKQNHCEVFKNIKMPLHGMFNISNYDKKLSTSIYSACTCTSPFLWCFKNWKIDQRTLQVQYALYSEVIHFTRRV